MEQLVTIELFGRPFTFKAESEVKHLKEVADFLVQEVSRVEKLQSSQSKSTSKLAIMILTALNLSNDNMEMKKSHSDVLKDISERTTELIHRLDSVVQ